MNDGNIGTLDRTLRIAFGIALITLFFNAEGSARLLGFLGIVPLLTGAVAWCPLYLLFNWDTKQAAH